MHLLLLVIAAAPPALDCELFTDVENPRRIFVRAPESWRAKADLSADAKKKVVEFLYEAAKVKSFRCSLMKGKVEDLDGYLWLEVTPDGALAERGPDFGPPTRKMVLPSLPPAPAPTEPKHGAKGLSRGAPVADPKALVGWLSNNKGRVMLPVRLKHGQAGFTGQGAKVGALELHCDFGPGVNLANDTRRFCDKATSCAVWMLGRWKGGKENVFAVDSLEVQVTGDEPLEMSAYAWSQTE